MNRYILIIFAYLFCCLSFVYAQTSGNLYLPLKVGDKVPNFEIKNLSNYASNTAKLSDFEGKLLLLDFWGTGCVSCIEAFPKMMQLQNEFGNKIQIILVNPWEDKAVVEKVFERRRRLANINVTLPSSCNDRTILQLFPLKSVPHVVWIDERGLVKFITHNDVVNSKNIRSILAKEDVVLKQKTDKKLSISTAKPLVSSNSDIDSELVLWQSALLKYTDGMPLTFNLKCDETNGYRIYAGSTAELLYRFAYSNRLDMLGNDVIPITASRTLFQVSDIERYAAKVGGEYQMDNFYVYQLISTKPATRKELQEIMQSDLKRYFGFIVKWEKRNVDCLVLTASDTSKIAYKEGSYSWEISDVHIKLNSLTVKQFINQLEQASNYYYSPYPIIDETGMNGQLGAIDIEGVDIYDFVQLDKALENFGLRFQRQVRELDILVISNPKENE